VSQPLRNASVCGTPGVIHLFVYPSVRGIEPIMIYTSTRECRKLSFITLLWLSKTTFSRKIYYFNTFIKLIIKYSQDVTIIEI